MAVISKGLPIVVPNMITESFGDSSTIISADGIEVANISFKVVFATEDALSICPFPM
jgi:hypothetical protein